MTLVSLNAPLLRVCPYGQVAQSVEQGTENPRVGSSILSLATIFLLHGLYDTKRALKKKVILNCLSRVKRKLDWPYRRLTWHHRMLADFLIVGAMKSGTSSLYAYLAQHPQLMPSYIKEVHFFDGCKAQQCTEKVNNFRKGEAWYRAHFPLKTDPHNRAFEATPLYLFYPHAAKRIFATNPEMKIIIILRNPTERAISHYFHVRQRGGESLPIMEALQADYDRQESDMIDEDGYRKKSFYYPSYKRRSLYSQQIKRFLRYFPKEQMLILSSEDLFAHPEHMVKQVFAFLGVDTEFTVKDLTPQNVAMNKVAVDPKVRQYLNDYFLPYNKELYALLDRDFGW